MKECRVRSATAADMPFIQSMVVRLRLDSEDLRAEQFIVVEESGRTVAFGRIKPYRRTFELGCVAVVEDRRQQGIGELVVRELIRRFPQRRVYVTTDVPQYFERLGFARTRALPRELSGMVYRKPDQASDEDGGTHDD
jgi:N-acetylglutamate synthase-like GNAT family acetyltransferase